MRILIIEDDENKRSQLHDFITDTLGVLDVLIAKSVSSGLNTILKEKPDLVILDMTLPTFDICAEEPGGRTQHYGGREILRQLDRRDMCVGVIIVTAFDVFGVGNDILTRTELEKQLLSAHPQNYRGTVYYNAALDGWKEELKSLIAINTR